MWVVLYVLAAIGAIVVAGGLWLAQDMWRNRHSDWLYDPEVAPPMSRAARERSVAKMQRAIDAHQRKLRQL